MSYRQVNIKSLGVAVLQANTLNAVIDPAAMYIGRVQVVRLLIRETTPWNVCAVDSTIRQRCDKRVTDINHAHRGDITHSPRASLTLVSCSQTQTDAQGYRPRCYTASDKALRVSLGLATRD